MVSKVEIECKQELHHLSRRVGILDQHVAGLGIQHHEVEGCAQCLYRLPQQAVHRAVTAKDLCPAHGQKAETVLLDQGLEQVVVHHVGDPLRLLAVPFPSHLYHMLPYLSECLRPSCAERQGHAHGRVRIHGQDSLAGLPEAVHHQRGQCGLSHAPLATQGDGDRLGLCFSRLLCGSFHCLSILSGFSETPAAGIVPGPGFGRARSVQLHDRPCRDSYRQPVWPDTPKDQGV